MDIMIPTAPQNCSATNDPELLKKWGVQEEEEILGLPSFWDWRDHDGVTPVKNQGHCGSCWTFSTIGGMESHYKIRYHEFRNMSEQQLVDCAGAFKNYGCNGGLPSQALEYIRYNGGITTEEQYPYKAKDQTCVYHEGMAVATTDGPFNITADNEDQAKVKLFAHGPISVAYQVIKGFGKYKSGVYHSDHCGTRPDQVNHAVLAVGYGVDVFGMEYWIVKNSWGAKWGDNGYFKIQRGVNMCAIAQCNSYPINVRPVNEAPKTFLE